jgi:ATP-binding cassette subfamily B protein
MLQLPNMNKKSDGILNTMSLKEKWNNFLSRGPVLWRTIRLVWRAAPGWTAAWLGIMIVQSLLPLAQVYLLRFTVNTLVNTFAGENLVDTIQTGAGWVILYAILMIVQLLIGNLGHWIQTAQSELVNDHINKQIHQKFLEIDYAYFEIPQFYDQLYRARNIGKYHALGLVSVLGNFLSSTITLVSMAGVLTPYGILFPVLLVVSTLPMAYVISLNNRREYTWNQKMTENMRRADYYDYLLTDRQTVVEVRMYNMGRRIVRMYQDLRQNLRNGRMGLVRRQSLRQTVASIFGLLIASGGLAFMAVRVLMGTLSLGDMALYYQAFNLGQSLVNSMVHSAGSVFNNILNMTNYFEFIDLKPKMKSLPADDPQAAGRVYRANEHWERVDTGEQVPMPLERSNGEAVEISVEHITFAYPESEVNVLEDFSLTFPAGSVTAIIGDNGAGKSTLVKLMCRLFDPQSGRILWNGADYRVFPLKELQSNITVLFPTITYYQTSVRENITMMDREEYTDAEMIRAAEDAGAVELIAKLSKGYETRLGKWFSGGTDLSSGQWQRIALARALFRKSSLLLLDEPTSSMDAWAESDWYERLRRALNGRTTVVITHRLSTAMRCDLIHVMVDGQIVESGTHQELLDLDGRYARAWYAQLKNSHTQERSEKPQISFAEPLNAGRD